jgi:glycosyltransferase involved in cell wall biosynthesis
MPGPCGRALRAWRAAMKRVAVVVKGYPRLSETFIAQEIFGLEQRGLAQLIVALRHPTDGKVHKVHEAIAADTLYLPEYLQDDPARVRQARRAAASMPGFARAEAIFAADLARDRSVNRRRRWGQACVLAHELPDDVDWLHAHFLHTPASVTRYAALLRGMGWSFSAHAKDIWTTPDWELAEKLHDAVFGVTCTQAGLRRLDDLAPGRTQLVYHGLDFGGIGARPSRRPGPFRILSVGRLVEKKGFDDLLAALASLDKGLDWRFDHIGGGELSGALRARADAAGLADRITWHGAQSRDVVFDHLAQADLFVLPARISRSGDRDGLPNVLMEALAFGVPAISTDVSGIPELIEHGRTGWLVPQRDPRALAAAIAALMADEALRQRLAAAGSQHVRKNFSCQPGIDAVAALLERHRPRAASAA